MRTRDRLTDGDPPKRRGNKAGAVNPAEPSRPARPAKRRKPGPAHMARLQAAAAAARRPGGLGSAIKLGKGQLKVDEMLREEDRAPYAAFLADPTHNRAQALAWLRDRGYSVGDRAVERHRSRFKTMLRDLRATAGLGVALGKLARQFGPLGLTDVTVTRLQQCLMERLMKPGREAGTFRDIPLDELKDLTRMIDKATGGRRVVESMRREFEQAKRDAADEANRLAARGVDGRTVANRVREILGIPLGDATPEEDDAWDAVPRLAGPPAAAGDAAAGAKDASSAL